MPKRASTEETELQAARRRVAELEEQAAALTAETDAAQLKEAWAKVEPWCRQHGLGAFYSVATKRGVAWWRARSDDSVEACKAHGNRNGWRFFYHRSAEDVAMYWTIATLTVGDTKFTMNRSNGGPVVLKVDSAAVFRWGRSYPPGWPEDRRSLLEDLVTPKPWDTKPALGVGEGHTQEARMLLALITPVQLGVLFCELCRTCREVRPDMVPCLHDERIIRTLWRDGDLLPLNRF